MRVKNFDQKIEDFIESLPKQTGARVVRTIELLQVFGNRLGMPHSRNVQDKLLELRIRGKQEVRIFYAFHEGDAVLLHGFIKKSQKIPPRELEVAMKKLGVLTGV